MPPRDPSATERRYAHTMKRLTPLSAIMGVGIEVATVVAVWDSPRAVAISIAAFVAMMGFNVWMHGRITAWGARRTEVVRLIVSVTVSVATNHLTGWPLPTWLWLPYQGLAADGHRRWNWTSLLAYVIPLTIVAAHDGVSFRRYAVFTFLAILARLFTDARLDILREMFERSEAQRLELDEAHARLKAEIAAREQIEAGLRQAQKLEAVGRLASGIAHEINTPAQFVSDSVQFLSEAVSGFVRVIEASRTSPVIAQRVAEEVDLPFLISEAPEAIRLTQVGLERITTIVRSMRQVAHADGQVMQPLDVNQAIKTAVTLAMSECKSVADVEMDLGDLPAVPCHGGEIMQVLLNLIVNAAHAVGETNRRGMIRIVTRRRDEAVEIAVSDTGAGIPARARDHIFEPFFTTKAIGKGTGQGLAIARSVVSRHDGELTFETGAGGTTFRVLLPLVHAKVTAAA